MLTLINAYSQLQLIESKINQENGTIKSYCKEVKQLREQIDPNENIKEFVNYIRGIVQKEVVKATKANPTGRSIALMATGSGKTKVGIDVLVDNFTDIRENNHIVSPTAILRDYGWKEEFTTWGKSDFYQGYTKGYCYKSLHNIKGERINYAILDEGHNITPISAKYFTQNVIDKALVLTATLNKKSDKYAIYMELGFRVVYKLSLQEAIDLGFVAPYEVIIVKVPLDKEKNIMKSAKATGRVFYTSEKSMSDYYTGVINDANMRQIKMARINRKKFLTTLLSKEKVAKRLIDFLPEDERHLIFGSSQEQAERLCIHSYHSKTNKKAYFDFKNKLISKLSCVNAIDEGHNLNEVDSASLMKIDANSIKLLQRIGRTLRYRPNFISRIFGFIAEDTQEEVWAQKALEDIDTSNVRILTLAEFNKEMYGEITN